MSSPTLHDAQLAIAREHGLTSWTALKEHIAQQARSVGSASADGAQSPEGHALTRLRWVISRSRDAGRTLRAVPGDGGQAGDLMWRPGEPTRPGNPAWTAPGEDELRAHFDGEFLSMMPPATLVELIVNWSLTSRRELLVLADAPLGRVP